MARLARVVMPGCPHHIIQRGNRRQKVFFSDKDKFIYLKLLKEQSQKYGLEFWAYCLMGNHVHLVAVPQNKESFRAVAETNRRYTQMINLREEWRGYLWQGRFSSFVMDEAYCYATVKYIENNPVRAKMVSRAYEYHFSSAKYHVYNRKDNLVVRCFLQDKIPDWKAYLNEEAGDINQIRKHGRTGRPLGSKEFIKNIEISLGRIISKQKPGPKAKMN
jgi:putative transposase